MIRLGHNVISPNAMSVGLLTAKVRPSYCKCPRDVNSRLKDVMKTKKVQMATQHEKGSAQSVEVCRRLTNLD